MRWLMFAFATTLSVTVSPSALAAEGHGEEAANPFAGTIANSITTLLTFGIVLFVLGKFVWPVVLKGLQRREQFIRESLENAKRDHEEAQKLLTEHKTMMESARQEASAIVDEGRRDAEVLRRKLADDAKADADAIMQRARREIGVARDSAVKDLYTLSGQLATELAGKIIEKEVDPKIHERLINESLDELAKQHGNN